MGPLAAILLLAAFALLATALVAGRGSSHAAVSRRVDQLAELSSPQQTQAPRTVPRLAHVEEFLAHAFKSGMRRNWGVRTRGRVLLMIGAGAGGLAALVLAFALQFPGWIVVLAALGVFAGAPRLFMMFAQGKAETQFTEDFPNALDGIIRMLRAGLPISAAIRSVGSGTSTALTSIFTTIADQVDVGVPLTDALAGSAKQIDLPDFRFFSVAVALQHTTGGNLTVTLDVLSEIVRKRRTARLRGRSVTAEVRMTAYVLAAIPFVVVGGLVFTNPSYLSPLIHDPRGNVIAGMAAGSLIVGFLTMHMMTQSATRL
jgi:tight adherence protein B